MLTVILLAVAGNGPVPPQAPCPPQAPVAAESRCPCSCGCRKVNGKECDCGLIEPCKCRETGCQCYRGQTCTCDAYARAYERAMREGKRLIVGVRCEPTGDGIKVRVEEFPGLLAGEAALVVGEPDGQGGMTRRDHVASAGKMTQTQSYRNSAAVCVSGT